MKRWLSSAFALTALLASQAATAAGGDVPQMDQAWFPNQLLWLAISFGLLFIVTSRFIAPRIDGILSARESAINEAIAEAEKAKRKADLTSGSIALESQSARVKAAEIMAQSQAEISKDAVKALAKLEHDLERKASHASAVLTDALRSANAEIDKAVENLAQMMVAKLIEPDQENGAEPKLKLASKR